MNTEQLNINPEAGCPNEDSGKASKAKKIAGESAKFAAAAGLGVAGTMAAEAMTSEEIDEDLVTEVDSVENLETAEGAVETPEEFDPNEIRLDETEENISSGSHVTTSTTTSEDVVDVDAPQPISQENDVAMVNPDEISLEHNPSNVTDDSDSLDPVDLIIDEYDGSDACDGFDHPQDLLADGDDPNDIDILDDLMA
ncbi:hypothetical protein [Bacteroides acidifaciens]|uniref:hypothetical protein n=1 Tax=Bacteroides acidifaciens TaxID=85831 RepID=UPI0026EE2760|nr:hypothetical protein [Bacteroides acidifaciens]